MTVFISNLISTYVKFFVHTNEFIYAFIVYEFFCTQIQIKIFKNIIMIKKSLKLLVLFSFFSLLKSSSISGKNSTVNHQNVRNNDLNPYFYIQYTYSYNLLY